MAFDFHCIKCIRMPADHTERGMCLAAGYYGEYYEPLGSRTWDQARAQLKQRARAALN